MKALSSFAEVIVYSLLAIIQLALLMAVCYGIGFIIRLPLFIISYIVGA